MLVTLSGMITFCKEEHLQNAAFSIWLRPSSTGRFTVDQRNLYGNAFDRGGNDCRRIRITLVIHDHVNAILLFDREDLFIIGKRLFADTEIRFGLNLFYFFKSFRRIQTVLVF